MQDGAHCRHSRIRDAGAVTIRTWRCGGILRRDVRSLTPLPGSRCRRGLKAAMSQQDLADLLAWLREKARRRRRHFLRFFMDKNSMSQNRLRGLRPAHAAIKHQGADSRACGPDRLTPRNFRRLRVSPSRIHRSRAMLADPSIDVVDHPLPKPARGAIQCCVARRQHVISRNRSRWWGSSR